MSQIKENYRISDDKNEIQIEKIHALLSNTYWAKNRNENKTINAIQNSECFSIFHLDQQVGFARVVTDYETVAYLADVVIDENHRGNGLGKLLVDTIVNDDRWKDELQILVTDDAHNLYKQYGFNDSNTLMMRG